MLRFSIFKGYMGEKMIKVPAMAAVVLEKDYRYLLVQEKKEKFYGLWNIPAGKVEPGETIEEAAEREVKEEAGYSVKLLGKIGVWDGDAIKHVFAGKISGGDLNVPNDEIMDAQWFSLEELEAMPDKLRHKWILEVIIKYQQEFKNFA